MDWCVNSLFVEVKENPETKELYLEFPDALLKEMNWKTGDKINWETGENNSWILTKV